MKNLLERSEIGFSQQAEAEAFFQKVADADVWEEVPASSVKAKEIPWCPIMASDIRNTIGLSKEVSIDSVQENMDENLCLGLKSPGGFYPIGETGFLSALQRAGFMQSVALSGREEKAYFKPLTPEERVIVLNLGLKTQKNKDLLLLRRDEKIRYVGSSEYVPLEFLKLMEILRNSLLKNFEDCSFVSSSAGHEYFTVTYDVKIPEVAHVFDTLMDEIGVAHDLPLIRVKLVSSDVGLSGANLYPYIRVTEMDLPIGRPLTLEHKGDCSYERFEENCEKILSVLKDCTKRMEQLSDYRMNHPTGAIRRICKAAGLPKKQSLEAADYFPDLYGTSGTGLDVYWHCFEVYETYAEASKSVNTARKLQIEEALTRSLYQMEEFDLPFDWE